ncbi:hypothetical protein NDU88_001813 [Pleurodeles waltl]|uniref:Uncharacterized protein n=1 Tax=Pleurodeles waltl TaxID=8319 RepID=A0AAV7R8B0_PLEWA|nr:hypothetical protein NDU88_001813 [Pleurodeles waltl]
MRRRQSLRVEEGLELLTGVKVKKQMGFTYWWSYVMAEQFTDQVSEVALLTTQRPPLSREGDERTAGRLKSGTKKGDGPQGSNSGENEREARMRGVIGSMRKKIEEVQEAKGTKNVTIKEKTRGEDGKRERGRGQPIRRAELSH